MKYTDWYEVVDFLNHVEGLIDGVSCTNKGTANEAFKLWLNMENSIALQKATTDIRIVIQKLFNCDSTPIISEKASFLLKKILKCLNDNNVNSVWLCNGGVE